MSTRAQIIVKDENEIYPHYIYKHSDGYPEGVLPVLEPLAKRFHGERGNEPDYLVAQIVRAFAIADHKDGYDSMLGWGIDSVAHEDTEYLYVVHSNTGKVEVRKYNQRGSWRIDRNQKFDI